MVGRVGLIIGAVVVLCCGGIAGLVAVVSPGPDASPAKPANLAGPVSSSAPASTAGVVEAADPPSASPAAVATPVIQTRIVTETQAIPYAVKTVKDSTLAKGTSKVRIRGVTGVKTLTYQVTLTDGVQTAKKLVRAVVSKAPVTQVVAVGTKVTQQCDPNYSGACVPIASDVDCAGGSGDGPKYVQGPVRVIGRDIYELDSDGDGIGCET